MRKKNKISKTRKVSEKITQRDQKLALYEAVLYQMALFNKGAFQVKIQPGQVSPIKTTIQKDMDGNGIITITALTLEGQPVTVEGISASEVQ